MSVARRNLKEAGLRGKKVPRRAKFRTDEQEVHIRLCKVDDSATEEEIQCYPKSYAVNATVTRNESYRSYPRRSHGCGGNSDSIADIATANREKSAEVIVP